MRMKGTSQVPAGGRWPEEAALPDTKTTQGGERRRRKAGLIKGEHGRREVEVLGGGGAVARAGSRSRRGGQRKNDSLWFLRVHGTV